MRSWHDIRLSPRDRAAIEEADQLLRARFPVQSLVLFGSKARGNDDAESDIDLLMLTSRELTASEQSGIVAALYPLQLRLDVFFSVLAVAAGEWWNGVTQATPIRAEVDREGVEVTDRPRAAA